VHIELPPLQVVAQLVTLAPPDGGDVPVGVPVLFVYMVTKFQIWLCKKEGERCFVLKRRKKHDKKGGRVESVGAYAPTGPM
jgi:hypothetical protein